MRGGPFGPPLFFVTQSPISALVIAEYSYPLGFVSPVDNAVEELQAAE